MEIVNKIVKSTGLPTATVRATVDLLIEAIRKASLKERTFISEVSVPSWSSDVKRKQHASSKQESASLFRLITSRYGYQARSLRL